MQAPWDGAWALYSLEATGPRINYAGASGLRVAYG